MKAFGKFLRARFLAGLVLLAPIAFTILVLYRVFQWLDGFLAPWIVQWLGRPIPGLGLLLTALVVLLSGFIMMHVAGRRLVVFGEWIIERLPLVRSLHRTARDLMSVVALPDAELFKEVVLAEYPSPGIHVYGFVTSYTELAEANRKTRMAHVFIPNPPVPTTGTLIVVPENSLLRLELSREETLKVIVSAGLVSGPQLQVKAAGIRPRE